MYQLTWTLVPLPKRFSQYQSLLRIKCLVSFKVKKKKKSPLNLHFLGYKVEHYSLFKNSSHLLFYELLTHKTFFNCQKKIQPNLFAIFLLFESAKSSHSHHTHIVFMFQNILISLEVHKKNLGLK